MALPKTGSREIACGLVGYWLVETFWLLHMAAPDTIAAREPVYGALSATVMIALPALLAVKAGQVAYDRHSYRRMYVEAQAENVDNQAGMTPPPGFAGS